MALLEQREGVPAKILRELDVSVDAIHERLSQLLEQAPKVAHESSQIYVTPRTARMLDRAKAEADRLNDEFIGTEHMLVALIQEDQGDVAQVISEFKVDLENVYQALQTVRGGHPRHRSSRREPLQVPRALQHRSDPAGRRRHSRSGDWA